MQNQDTQRAKPAPACPVLHALEGITQLDIGYVGGSTQELN